MSFNLITEFYDICITILTFVLCIVLIAGTAIYLNKYSNFAIKNNHIVEIIWAILPFVILVFMAVPSIETLYMSRVSHNIRKRKVNTIRVSAEQWRWNIYVSNGSKKEELTYNMKTWQDNTFERGAAKKLSRSAFEPYAYRSRNSLKLKNRNNIKVNVTSSDVIHSFFLPSLRLKIDAIPGTIQEVVVWFNRHGKFYGICAEYCGFYHSIIPFSVSYTT